MSQPFFDVFDTVTVPGDLREAFARVSVKHIAMSKDETTLRVHLTDDAPALSNETIWRMQEEISSRLFRQQRSVRIIAPRILEETREAEESTGSGKSSGVKRSSSNATLYYGRRFRERILPIHSLQESDEQQTVNGQVIDCEEFAIKGGRSIVSFVITDYTDSIKSKVFVSDKNKDKLLAGITPGRWVQVSGFVRYDSFEKDPVLTHVVGICEGEDCSLQRMDTAARKRVELHCHTQMSDMDAVSPVSKLLARAHEWGHGAMAITDHGVVQAFPDALKYLRKDLPPEDPFKVIYGLEGYLVDDLQNITHGRPERRLADTIVALDFETTGFSRIGDRIIEIGAVKITNGEKGEVFSSYVDPERKLPYRITELTGITPQMLEKAPKIEEILPQFLDFIGGAMIVAHNAGFDIGFLEQACRRCGIERSFDYLDTIDLAHFLLPELKRFGLSPVAKALSVKLQHHHRATDDAVACGEIYAALQARLNAQGIETVGQLHGLVQQNGIDPRTLHPYHVILLAQNETGRVNLYTLVSKSHLDYCPGGIGKPRIPKSELNRYREGLIIGSACSLGEPASAIIAGEDEEKLEQIASWYDYLEIQPIGNNQYLIADERTPDITSEEDLRELNRRIVALGEKLNKPVCATGDVHFLDPEDEVYRRIIQAGKGYDDADDQPPLYLRTTDEMLEEFAYLGKEKAEEVVIDNTRMIADQIEVISPVRPDKCPPIIEDADRDLEEICYGRAHEIYGDELPEIVEKRLEKELHSIISNNYAGLYIVARKLVVKSNEDGYLVGSRGSVGSSFVATMAGITEVNPLPPHYHCRKCRYSEFDSERIRRSGAECGWDMPDAICPVCGEPLTKDGFDIPFETFLGFSGNKEPDIDLNFSGDYQSEAHKYTEVLFGEGHTFRAGTISTVKDKIAFGYVKNYFEERGEAPRKCELERIIRGCVGIRRGTGQHPGGIVVLPQGENIHSFTPIQHPANDMTSDIITTHFEYHSIDSNLLKLDILGHDDPTMIKMLEELVPQLTGEPFHATEIPLDDPDVMSLFASTEALGITPDQIGGCPLGCLGVPEFGTNFVIPMVEEAGPKSLADLVRISGLSHGTDVWANNAQELIKSGTATLGSCICTRDDIMLYLIGKGVDKEQSFKIMENVRKGRDLTREQERTMLEHDVPQWYLDSCNKIKYMFPKAHAAAYVTMAYRIAYCKVNYPLAYYAAFFTIRADAFSYALMCHGPEKVAFMIDKLNARKQGKDSEPMTAKDEDTLRDLRVVQEMYARGFEFLPLDIYESRAHAFRIVDGKLLPPFDSIEGMGEKAAAGAEAAAADGPYLSRADFQRRTHLNSTIVETMENEGLFGDLPKDEQISLFDLLK